MIVVIGDVHGHCDKLRKLMQANGLIDGNGKWAAGVTHVWFMGDYFDRGPDGIGVIELIMRLQAEAAAAGGKVGALLGNHDVHFLAAHELGNAPDGSRERTFLGSWHANGGLDHDLQRLGQHHITWLKALPAMALVESYLLAHADATFYGNYGKTIDTVNEAITSVLFSESPKDWDDLLDYFSQRRAFEDRFLGRERAARFIKTYGGRLFVHAHTPVAKLTGKSPVEVCQAYVYAGGLCIDVDPGLYLGGPGFVTRLEGA